MEMNNEKDDILFAQLKRAKRRKRRKVLISTFVLLVLAGAAVVMGVNYLRSRVRAQFAAGTVEVQSFEAVSGRISTVVSGSGTLSYIDHQDITVPAGVTVEDLLVKAGDTVTAGTAIATVDINSVMTALAESQTALDKLDTQINSAKNDTVSSYMKAAVTGRIKAVFVKNGDKVVDVMTEHGALAIISLDGFMTVTIDASLNPGASVSVVTGGKTYPGTVESSVSGRSVINLTDNGPIYGAEATVKDSSGTVVGTGTLAIRNPLSVTGYAGTVGWVNAQENQQVYSGSSLFTLNNTSYSANYDTLLRDRAEAEKTLNTLIGLLRSGYVEAPIDGIITAVTDSSDTPAAAAAALASAGSAPLAVIAPSEKVSVSVAVDETDILSLEVGQSADVKVSSIGDDTYRGTVTEISKVGVSASGVTQYSAVITLNKDPKMLSGMTASVDIQIQGVDDVVLIPVDALHRTRDIAYVFTSYDAELKQYGGMVEVVTGVSNSTRVEIVSGLKPGDTVYYTEKASTNSGFTLPGNWGGNRGSSGGGNSRGSWNGGNSGGNAPRNGG